MTLEELRRWMARIDIERRLDEIEQQRWPTFYVHDEKTKALIVEHWPTATVEVSSMVPSNQLFFVDHELIETKGAHPTWMK